MAHLNYDYYYNVPESKGASNSMTGGTPNAKSESNKYSSSLNNSIYSAYMPPPSFGPYSSSPAPYMASAAVVSDPFSLMNMSSASSALYVDHGTLFNNNKARAPSREPKPHLKSYYDHRYSSYEPMYDYFNYANNNNMTQNQSSPHSPSVLSNGDKTPVNRRPIKIKNLTGKETTATATTTTSSDDSEFKAFKDKYNLTGSDNQPRLSNRHSINIDNLTYQAKDGPLTEKKMSKEKERLASNHLNGSRNGLEELETKSEAETKNRLKQMSARNTSKTPTVLMSEPISNSTNGGVKSTSSSESSPHGANSGSKESPLFQKIMAKLAELPDSVLVKNYKSGSNENKDDASRHTSSSRTTDQAISSKTAATKSTPLSSASTPKSSVDKPTGVVSG